MSHARICEGASAPGAAGGDLSGSPGASGARERTDLEVEFTDECTGCFRDQTNHLMTAFVVQHGADRVRMSAAATLEYTIFQGIPSISMIRCVEMPRRGLATRLLQRLQAAHPLQEILWGYMTDSGRMLRDSATLVTRNDAYFRLIHRLAGVDEQLRQLSANESSATSPEAWNDLHDLRDELARALDSEPAQRRWVRMASACDLEADEVADSEPERQRQRVPA